MNAIEPIWNAFLVYPLISLLVGAYDLVGDFGLAIVILTVAIRLVLFPLYVQMIRSQRTMQELGPAMNELKSKYGKDRQRLTEEQMKLYKERGYNPLSGCLPLLLQMPLLFALYSALTQAGCGLGPPPDNACPGLTGEQLQQILFPFVPNPFASGGTLDTGARWLPWIKEGLAHPDPWHVLPVLAGATQFVASIMAQPSKKVVSDDPQARMMQSMTYYYPVITIFIAWGFASGLALYWVTTTVFQIVQQYFVSGWGQLPRFLPFLNNIPTPADREMRRGTAEAIAEVEKDMGGSAVTAPAVTSSRAARRERKRGKR